MVYDFEYNMNEKIMSEYKDDWNITFVIIPPRWCDAMND